MRMRIYQSRLARLLRQRRQASLLVGVLILLNFVQAITLLPILDHQKKILIPAGLSEQAWVSEHDVSANYVLAMTRLLCDLRFNLTPSNAHDQAKTLLRYVHPAFYGTLKHQLTAEMKKIKKEHLSSVFYPASFDVHVNGHQKTVDVIGDLTVWLDQHQMSTQHQHYRLTFYYEHGQLSLTGLAQFQPKDD